ncbi:unnamed protein product [Durusdinium trenchii]|uniref:Uncharacterized protein n=1 Tax=Durusdinium trenchii TaxID=1381693 RepID=A0ABP0MIS5_9DINO
MEDDEEAAAWAALRAAFGEDPEEARTVKKPRVEPTTENSPRKAPPKRSDSTDDWLQGEAPLPADVVTVFVRGASGGSAGGGDPAIGQAAFAYGAAARLR